MERHEKILFIDGLAVSEGVVVDEDVFNFGIKIGDRYIVTKKKNVFSDEEEAKKELNNKINKYKENIISEINTLGLQGFMEELLIDNKRSDWVLLEVFKEKLRWLDE